MADHHDGDPSQQQQQHRPMQPPPAAALNAADRVGLQHMPLTAASTPFRLQNMYYKPVRERITQSEGAAAEESQRDQGDMRPSVAACWLVDRGAYIQEAEIMDAHSYTVITFPASCWAEAQSYTDIKKDTPTEMMFFRAVDFILRAYSNPRIGTNSQKPHEPSSTYSVKSRRARTAGQAVMIPKVRYFWEKLAPEHYDPDVHTMRDLRRPENDRGHRLWIFAFDPRYHFWWAIMDRLWRNRMHVGLTSKPTYEFWNKIASAIANNYTEKIAEYEAAMAPAAPNPHAGSGGLTARYLYNIYAVCKMRKRGVTVIEVDNIFRQDDIFGVTEQEDDRAALAERRRQEEARAIQQGQEPVVEGAVQRNKDAFKRLARLKDTNGDIRKKREKKDAVKSRRDEKTGNTLRAEDYSRDTVCTMDVLCTQVLGFLLDEPEAESPVNFRGRYDYDIGNPESPVNPLKVLSFERSCEFLRLEDASMQVSPCHLDLDNYIDPVDGQIHFPIPQLVCELSMEQVRPDYLCRYYLPLTRPLLADRISEMRAEDLAAEQLLRQEQEAQQLATSQATIDAIGASAYAELCEQLDRQTTGRLGTGNAAGLSRMLKNVSSINYIHGMASGTELARRRLGSREILGPVGDEIATMRRLRHEVDSLIARDPSRAAELMPLYRAEALERHVALYRMERKDLPDVQRSMILHLKGRNSPHLWWPHFKVYDNITIFSNGKAFSMLELELAELSYNTHNLQLMMVENCAVDAYEHGATNGLHLKLIGPPAGGKSFAMQQCQRMLPGGSGSEETHQSTQSANVPEVRDGCSVFKDEGDPIFSGHGNVKGGGSPDDDKRVAITKSQLAQGFVSWCVMTWDPVTGERRRDAAKVSAHVTLIIAQNFQNAADDALQTRLIMRWCNQPERPDKPLQEMAHGSTDRNTSGFSLATAVRQHHQDNCALAHRIMTASALGAIPSVCTEFFSFFMWHFTAKMRSFGIVNPDENFRIVGRAMRYAITNTIAYVRDVNFAGELSPCVMWSPDKMRIVGAKHFQERDISCVGQDMFCTQDIAAFSCSQSYREWNDPDIQRPVQFAARYLAGFHERYFRELYSEAEANGWLMMPNIVHVLQERHPEWFDAETGAPLPEYQADIEAAVPSFITEWDDMLAEMNYERCNSKETDDDRFGIEFAKRALFSNGGNVSALSNPELLSSFVAGKQLQEQQQEQQQDDRKLISGKRGAAVFKASRQNLKNITELQASLQMSEDEKLAMLKLCQSDRNMAVATEKQLRQLLLANPKPAGPVSVTTVASGDTVMGTGAASTGRAFEYNPMYVSIQGTFEEVARRVPAPFEPWGRTDYTIVKNQLEVLSRKRILAPIIKKINSPYDKMQFVHSADPNATGVHTLARVKIPVVEQVMVGTTMYTNISTHWLMNNCMHMLAECLAAPDCATTRSETGIVDLVHARAPYLFHTWKFEPKPGVKLPYGKREKFVSSIVESIFRSHADDFARMSVDEVQARAKDLPEAKDARGVKSQYQQALNDVELSAEVDRKMAVLMEAMNNNQYADKVVEAAEQAVEANPDTEEVSVPAPPPPPSADSDPDERAAKVAKQLRTGQNLALRVPGLYSIARPPEGWEKSQRYVGDEEESAEAPDGVMWKRWYSHEFAVDMDTLEQNLDKYNSYPGRYRELSNKVLNSVDEFTGLREKRREGYYQYPKVHLDELDTMEEKRAKVERGSSAAATARRPFKGRLRLYNPAVPSERAKRREAVATCLQLLEKFVTAQTEKIMTIKTGGDVPTLQGPTTTPALTHDPSATTPLEGSPPVEIDPAVLQYEQERLAAQTQYDEPEHHLSEGQEVVAIQTDVVGVLQHEETQSGSVLGEEPRVEELAPEAENEEMPPAPELDDGGVVESPPQSLVRRKRPAAAAVEHAGDDDAPVLDIIQKLQAKQSALEAAAPKNRLLKKSRGPDPAHVQLMAALSHKQGK